MDSLPGSLALFLSVVLLGACRGPAHAPEPGPDIGQVLDAFHAAAARADGEAYFAQLDEDAVFLGTDASERWSKAEFQAFCDPYFSKGIGWTYACRERHVRAEGDIAWFDERLWNEKYGECRGTGALRFSAGRWRIVQYSLSLPIPNAIAAEVVERIRAH